MTDKELDFTSEEKPKDLSPKTVKPIGAIFNFAPRTVVIFVFEKWPWILGIFAVSLVAFWLALSYKGKHGDEAWTAQARVLHQARSDRIPTFYKPFDTQTVSQFISSRAVFNRVRERMENSKFPPNPKMFMHVDISSGRGKQNMITILVSEKSPEFAAAVANALAEEGVNEYVSTQNKSVKTMIDDRTKQRDELNEEISAIEDQKKQYYSPKTGFSPTVELDTKRQEISSLLASQSEASVKLKTIETRIRITKEVLEKTPRNVEFETIIDNTSNLGVEGKIIELELMRKRYTEDNPKVKVLDEEIKMMLERKAQNKDAAAARVTYRNNEIYNSLLMQLTTLELDLAAAKASLSQYDAEIIQKREEMDSLIERQKPYDLLDKRQKMLEAKVSKINEKINDFEILLSSATPDVYIFEHAKIPAKSNAGKALLKSIVASAFLAFLAAFCLAAYKIGKLKLASAKEFKIALGIDNLGDIPEDGIFPEEAQHSAIQRVRKNILEAAKNAKIITFIFYEPHTRWDDYIEEMSDMNSIKGLKCFRLKCHVLGSIAGKPDSELNPEDSLAQKLISIKKFADDGEFFYQNPYSLDLAERDLLEFDLKVLSEEYDFIDIEVDRDMENSQVCAQLAALSGYTALFVPFDRINKLELEATINLIKENSSAALGGVLLEVPKINFRY